MRYICYCSLAPFAKPPLRGSPLLRSSFLLIDWRSLRTFMQADFHASMKSAHKNVRVNCSYSCSSRLIFAFSRLAARIKNRMESTGH